MCPSRSENRSSAGAKSLNRRLVPADKLKREIQAVLTDELAQDQYRSGFGKYDGFAYVAAEAYFHLAGGYDTGLHPMQLRGMPGGAGGLIGPQSGQAAGPVGAPAGEARA